MSNRVYVVPPPGYPGRNELYIAKHLVEHLRGEVRVLGEMKTYDVGVSRGFYDVGTWLGHQVSILVNLMRSDIQTGDHLVFVDFWHPGLDMIWLWLEDKNIHPVTIGYLHGASFVEGDLVDFSSWVSHIEGAWMEMYDCIWAASRFFIRRMPAEYLSKVQIVGEPFVTETFLPYRCVDHKKRYDVVFPHRLAPDKGVEDLFSILEDCSDLSFLITAACPPDPRYTERIKKFKNVTLSVGLGEWEHVRNLASAKVVLSTAVQEGWGYAVLKSIAVGCIPVLPDRAVYPELYESKFLYRSLGEAVEMLRQRCDAYPRGVFVPPTTIVGGELRNGILTR